MPPSPTNGCPIKPGTDGALMLAIIREIIALGLYDREFLARYTNAGQLVNQDRSQQRFRHDDAQP